MSAAVVHIGERTLEVGVGLIAVEEVYQLAGCPDGQLRLIRADGSAVAVRASEYLVVRGGERFAIADESADPDPILPGPVAPEFNGSRELSFSEAKISGRELREKDADFPGGRLFGEVEGEFDVEVLDHMVIVLQEADVYFVVPQPDGHAPGDPIDIEECGRHGRRPPRWRRYRIKIDGEKFTVDSRVITGAEILALVDKMPVDWSLNRKLHGGRRVRVQPDEEVDLSLCDVERFESVPKQAQAG